MMVLITGTVGSTYNLDKNLVTKKEVFGAAWRDAWLGWDQGGQAGWRAGGTGEVRRHACRE